jgi:dipeptidyl aminopeptidase/acylaminoacyl peptidase
MSRNSLLGRNPTEEALDLMSVEKHVTAETPPTLLIHSQRDQMVSVENSILFYQALTQAKVPAEMYLFDRGYHGMGMKPGLGSASEWPERMSDWLKERGLLENAKLDNSKRGK